MTVLLGSRPVNFITAVLILMLLAGWILPAPPVNAQTEPAESDRQDSKAAGTFGNQEAHHESRFSLRRAGDRIYAVLSTTRSPVQYWARQNPEPLFFVPTDYRPPVSVIREVEGRHVLIDGTPDPAQPHPRRFQLQVKPDGSVWYVDDSNIDGVGYLSYDLETMWGATLASNFAATQEILAATWADEGFHPLPANPYVKPTPAPVVAPEEPALTLKLEAAANSVTPQVSAPLGKARRLPEAAAAELLNTVPGLEVQAGGSAPNLPIERRDIPPVGGLEVQTFEPKPDQVSSLSDSSPLEVTRFTPSGPVDWVPRVHIVFSKPMVPLSSHAALADHIPEVSLSPPIQGEWQWQGTQTLLFQLTEPPVGSTRYEVKVAPGIEALDSSSLENGFTGAFETPRLQLESAWPYRNAALGLEPYLVLRFSQSINPEDLLPFLALKAGPSPVGFEPISLADPSLPRQVQEVLARGAPERTLVLKPSALLSPDTTYTLSVARGAPSADGPLRTLEAQQTAWRTYGPLKVTSASCNGSCLPGDSFHIGFSNPLDTDSLRDGTVSIRPELPDGAIHINPGGIWLTGSTAPDTVYTLRIAPGLTDVYGQSLNHVEEKQFGVARLYETLGTEELHLPNFLEVLHPDDRGEYSIFTRNLDTLEIALYRVTPADWDTYIGVARGLWGPSWGTTGPNSRRKFAFVEQGAAGLPGFQDRDPVLETSLAIDNQPGSEIDQTILDLNPFLDHGRGHLMLVIDIPAEISQLPGRGGVFCGHPGSVAAWLQITDVSLDAHTDGTTILTRASALKSGEPIEALTAHFPSQFASIPSVDSDTDGYAASQLASHPEDWYHRWELIVGQDGSDSAFVPVSNYRLRNRMYVSDRVHVFSDRYLYQPGEEVRVKGWLRQIEFAPTGDLSWVSGEVQNVDFSVEDARGVSLGQGQTTLTPHGAFDFQFDVPEDANAGLGTVHMRLHDDVYESMRFRIEEFRRPEFEVSLSVGEGHNLLDAPVLVETQARYYGGGALEGAQITWKTSGRQANYSPPGWHDFVFGDVVPWWWWWGDPYQDSVSEQELTAELDFQGRHQATLTLASDGETARPHVLQVEASVQDLSQQALSASSRILVHPSLWYVGGKTASNVGQVGQPFSLNAVVTDIDGNPVAEQEIQVTAQQVYGRNDRDDAKTDSPACTLRSAIEPASCDLVFPEGGLWRIEMAVEDSAGRKNITRLTRWIAGGDRRFSSPDSEEPTVTLIADKDAYRPGDVAEIQVQSPIVPAQGTVILNRSGIVRHEPVYIESASQALSVPIKDAHVPNLHVSVYVTGALQPLAADGQVVSNQAEGHINLSVPTSARELGVDLQVVTQVVAPKGKASVSVRITDPSGQPVPGAEVVLMAVDEAVLALAGYRHAHPLQTFYPERQKYLYHDSLYSYLQSKDFYMPWHLCMGGGSGGGGDEPLADLFPVRSDFNPLAFFEPAGQTDESGIFRASWQVPDTIGRYRVVAMASTGPRYFGLSESSYTVRLPLSLRPQWPRFLNYDDHADFSVLVENQSNEEQGLVLVAQSDRLELAYQSEDRNFDALAFSLPARSRRQILLPVYAQQTGAGQMMVTVFNERFNDTVLGELPIYTPAAQQGFATYGTADELPVMQGLELPADVHQEFGQLTITASSTLLQSLLDSFLQLRRHSRYIYPELLASRMMANVALRDVLYAFQLPDLPDPARLDRDIRTDIKDLLKLQLHSGGWSHWHRDGETWPFGSVHAMHALAVAQAAGYPVDEGKLQYGLRYLQNIESSFPDHYSQLTRRYITAYALYVRSLLDDIDAHRAALLLSQLPDRTGELDVIAWSLLVLHADSSHENTVAQWYRYVLNRADETTGKVVFARQTHQENGHLILHSNRRSDALLLRMLMTVQPDADLIPKVVRSLMAARNRYGHWGSSQENLFVMQAMNQYFQAFEAAEPDFLARVWLDDILVMDSPFQGRDTELRQVSLPMDWLYSEEPSRIHVQRQGEGRMYYRLGFDYVPDDLQIDSLDRGFAVERSYRGLDDPDDVWLDADGRWHVKLGARVQINVTMTARGTRHHVKLVSPLPAGLEFLNPALKGTEAFDDPNARGRFYWYWPWFDHQQLLDERAQAVTAYLWGGVYQYGAVARATTAGTFHVPPARALEIYAPETFGHGASEVLIVEPD